MMGTNSMIMGGQNMMMGHNPMMGQGNMFYNPYAMNMGLGMVNPMMNMQALNEPLNQGQIDMVERWRQSVMQ